MRPTIGCSNSSNGLGSRSTSTVVQHPQRERLPRVSVQKTLDTPIDMGIEDGSNPRLLERQQMIRLMSLFAEVFFVGHWDPELADDDSKTDC